MDEIDYTDRIFLLRPVRKSNIPKRSDGIVVFASLIYHAFVKGLQLPLELIEVGFTFGLYQ